MYNEKTTESAVSLTLSANAFDSSTYIARVPQKALGLENIVSEIAKRYPSIDPYVINHAAELLKEQILSFIKEGRAVNILEIVTVYPAPTGTVSSANPQSAGLPGLELRFRATKEAEAALSSVKAASCMIKTNEPSIRRVISLKDGNEAGILHKGYPARIEGENLKIVGEDAGVFLVPEDSGGEMSEDEGAWIKAAGASYMPTNKPKTLEFYLPDEAEAGKSYFVAVRTRYCRSCIPRKKAVTGFSPRLVAIRE